MHDPKLRGVANTLEYRIQIQRNFDNTVTRQQNKIQQKIKFKMVGLYIRRKKQIHKYRTKDNWVGLAVSHPRRI